MSDGQGDRDADPRIEEATRQFSDALGANKPHVAAQWFGVKFRLSQGEAVEWPPVIRESMVERLSTSRALRPLVLLGAAAWLTREALSTHGQMCELCEQPVRVWDAKVRGVSGRNGMAGQVTERSTVTHRACSERSARYQAS